MNLTDPILSVRDLRVHFELPEGLVRAVEGIDFDVRPGATMALVGESGCGKTVTARAILRLIDKPGRIIGGRILFQRVDDSSATTTEDLAQLPADGRRMRTVRGREIAIIFQEPMASFSPVHTVGTQIVEAICVHRNISRRQARTEAIELLRHTGVPEPAARLRNFPHELSGGLLQRAMIAMALCCRPRILIADEPTTALDVTTQAQILTLLKRLQEETQMAIIFITHDLGVVAEMADEVVVMYLGEVVERGPVDAIFHSPKHPYTKAMLRAIPPLRSKLTRTLEAITGSIPHPLQRPSGCPFHSRCTEFIAGKCDQQLPPRRTVGPSHEVQCFLYESENTS